MIAGRERGRELEHEARQPAGGVERLEDPQRALDQGLLELVGEHDPAAAGGLDVVAQVARERVERRGVARQRAVHLDREPESGGVIAAHRSTVLADGSA